MLPVVSVSVFPFPIVRPLFFFFASIPNRHYNYRRGFFFFMSTCRRNLLKRFISSHRKQEIDGTRSHRYRGLTIFFSSHRYILEYQNYYTQENRLRYKCEKFKSVRKSRNTVFFFLQKCI